MIDHKLMTMDDGQLQLYFKYQDPNIVEKEFAELKQAYSDNCREYLVTKLETKKYFSIIECYFVATSVEILTAHLKDLRETQ